jgi:ribonucleoside-diphosphate reductase alpha chain
MKPNDSYEGGSGRVHDEQQPHSEHRRRMPMERRSLTHKVMISGQEGYITAGMYEDGTLGELFIAGFGKEGSTQVGWINSWAIAVSHALQYGSSLRSLARKYHLMTFEPNGKTDNPELPTCRSVPDYVFKWLVLHFGDDDLKKEILG